MPRILRHALVLAHRWVGLAMVVFLVLEGLTGSILAFERPIGRWLEAPPPQTSGDRTAPTLDMATLATAAEQLEPMIQGAYFMSTGPDIAVLRCVPRVDPATGKPFEVDFTHVVLDARTGKELRHLPDRGAGRRFADQVLPFIKDLHYNLVVGNTGVWILFFVALAWTLDCLVSFLLTLPVSTSRFWARWKPAWLVKRGASATRLNFDVHRAGGLWFLLVLFVFAWSSVELEDESAGIGLYDAVTSRLFDYRRPDDAIAAWPRHDSTPLKLDWYAAQARGEELMAQQARDHGFKIVAPVSLVKFAENGLYNYEVDTDRSFPDAVREVVFFDGDTGEPRIMPGFERHTGNVISDWLRALHMATDPIDYAPYHAFVCLFGIVLSVITVTGVCIWTAKRSARTARGRRT